MAKKITKKTKKSTKKNELIYSYWIKYPVSPLQVKKSLQKGETIYLKATAMQNGSHAYYLKNGIPKSYGQGVGWRDQNDELNMSLTQLCNYISKRSQKEKILFNYD